MIISPGERERDGFKRVPLLASTSQNEVSELTLYCAIGFVLYLIPTWINGATDDPPQRIPCPVVKPVVKLIKSFLCQEAGGTVVEVPAGERRV